MKIKWESLLTTTLVICALTTTVLVFHKEFYSAKITSSQVPGKPVQVADWRSKLTSGESLGSADAPVQVVEFGDFECPFCADFHNRLRLLKQRYPGKVSITYVHFPLQGHRFALPAARVAECAGEQGRFEAMYDQLYENQESFGLKSWADFAAAAGVPDLARFDTCSRQTTPVPRVEQGVQFGHRLDVKATPTVIVNGWLLSQPPSEEELERMIKLILAGKNPVSGKS